MMMVKVLLVSEQLQRQLANRTTSNMVTEKAIGACLEKISNRLKPDLIAIYTAGLACFLCRECCKCLPSGMQ
jgi:hypothetical protein